MPELERAEVFQGYLGISPEVRIRSKRVGEAETYRLCFKGEGSLVREEIELDLDKATFESLKKLLPKPMIRKEYRIYRLENGLRLECSRVDQAQTRNFITLRWNFRISSRQRFFPPDFLGKEVTYDGSYRMKAYYQRKNRRSAMRCLVIYNPAAGKRERTAECGSRYGATAKRRNRPGRSGDTISRPR